MGLFDGAKKKEEHRALLDVARQLLEKIRSPDAPKRIPVEFWEHIWLEAEDLQFHVENTDPKDLGNGRLMKELAEAAVMVATLTGDQIHPDTRRGFRTKYFDGAVEKCAQLEAEAHKPQILLHLTADSLEQAIKSAETALRWFDELPAPQSKKYSAEQARTIVTLSKQTLDGLHEKLGERRKPAPAPAPAPAKPTSVPTAHACSKCGAANDTDAKFCESCGLSFAARACSSCNAANKADAKFCKACGKPLTS
jgi:hypothetical protein